MKVKRVIGLLGLVMSITGIVQAGDVVFHWENNAEAIKSNWVGNYELKKLDDASGDNIVIDNSATMISKDLIPVDYSKKYELSGGFKSNGKTKSKILFGFAVFDKNKNEINAINANPIPDAVVTELVQPAQKGSKSIVVKNVDGWKLDKTYAIAFDAAADFSDLPNRNIITGVLKIVKKDEQYEIMFDTPLNRDYPAGTAIREHYEAFGTYTYTAAKGVEVPDKWEKYAGLISGAKDGKASHNLFRPGTAFVKIILLPNFGQKGSDAQLAVNNIELKEIE